MKKLLLLLSLLTPLLSDAQIWTHSGDTFFPGTNTTFTPVGVGHWIISSTGSGGGGGVNGTNGTNGKNGTNGLNGATGAVGPVGPIGPSGGVPGTNGLNGVNGTNGLPGSNGTNGVNGVSGTNGLNGVNGTNGAQGIAGTNGVNGINGTNGIQGIQGVAGANGTNGLNGINGTNGAAGATGATGATGPQGPSGTGGTNLLVTQVISGNYNGIMPNFAPSNSVTIAIDSSDNGEWFFYNGTWHAGFNSWDAGMILWLDASIGTWQDTNATVPATTNRAVVKRWDDLSRLGNYVLNPVSTDTLDSGALTNGLPAVFFGGSTNGSPLNTVSSNSLPTPLYYFIVVKRTNAPSSGSPPFISAKSSDVTSAFYFYANDPGVTMVAYNGAFVSANNSFANQLQWELMRIVFIVGGNATIWRNGVNIGAGSVGSTAGWGLTLAPPFLGSPVFNGDFAEIIVCTNTITDPHIAIIEGYLNSKYKIY